MMNAVLLRLHKGHIVIRVRQRKGSLVVSTYCAVLILVRLTVPNAEARVLLIEAA